MPESPPDPGAAPAEAGAGASIDFRHTYFGPNPYASEPAIVAEVRFAREALATGRQRCARIAALSKAAFEPPPVPARCDTPLAVAEYLAAWTLRALTHHRGFLHTARALIDDDGAVLVAIGFHHARISGRLLRFAADAFALADTITAKWFRDGLLGIWNDDRRAHPDYQITFVMQAARAAGVPYQPALSYQKTWQFGWGARSELFMESQGSADSAIGDRISADKPAAKGFLHALGVPGPRHVLARKVEDADLASREIGFPCVVKPTNGGRSVGVTTDITTLEQLSETIAKTLKKYGSAVMVEQQVPGEVYRILVARGRTACVVRRAAPHVTGDGTATVRQLIEAHNAATARARSGVDYIGEIPLDEDCEAALAREGLGFDEVVEAGRRVPLRRIPLLSSGAVYTDVTAQTHPDTLRTAEMITAALRIENCGLDFVTPDITRPMSELGGILEVNTMPGLRVPLIAGIDPVAVGRMILGEHAARIPAKLLIAPKARLAKVRDGVRFADGVGWAIGKHVGVGKVALALQPATLTTGLIPSVHHAAATVTRNPLARSLFVAAPLAPIVEHGLPLDCFDTIVCLECTPDPAWERVLRAASGTYLATSDPREALAACGLASGPKRRPVDEVAP